MARPLVKSLFVLLALGFLIFASSSLAEDEDLGSLNQRIYKLFAEGKYQEAIPLAEKAVEIATRVLGPEDPETATSLNNLGELYSNMHQYAKAEALLQEALRIRQKVLGREHPYTAFSLNNLGILYQAMAKYAKAEPLYQEALRIRRKVLGREHPDTALILNNLGTLYQAMVEYPKAETILQEAVRIYQKALGSEHQDTAMSLDNLGMLYQAMGEYGKAEPLLQEGLRVYRKVSGSEHPDTATSLNNLAMLYLAMGEYPEAEPLYQEALRIYQKVLGPEHPYTATGLDNLGELYSRTGEYPKSEPLLQEALRIRQKVLGSENPDTAQSLNDLAELYRAMGEYPKAESFYQGALRIRQKVFGSENPDTAQSLNNLAELYRVMNEYVKAEPLYQEALRIDRKVLGSEHPGTGQVLNNLALLYQAIGDYAKAESLYQEALRIDRKVLGPEHPDTAISLDNLATLYQAMGEYGKTEPLLQEALNILQKALGSEHPYTVTSLNALGELYQAMGEYAKAEPLYQEALRIRQKALGSENPDTAISLNNLAALYLNMGEYAKAEPLYREALRIDRKVLGSEHRDTARTLNNLAELYWETDEYAKAEPLYQEALRIQQKILGTEHPDTASTLDKLASLEFDLDRIDEATVLARQASAAKLTVLSKIFSFTSEQQRLAYLDIFNPYSLYAVLKGTETDLAEAVLRYKGIVLDSIVEDRLRAEAGGGDEGQKLVEQLNLDKRQLGQLYLQPAQELSAETNQRIEALEREVEKIEGQLARHVAGLGHARHALSVSLEQVQPTIPEDGALIEYVRYRHYLGKGKSEPRCGAIVLFSRGAPIWIPLGKAKEIEHLVRRYSALVRGSPQEEELSANLQALYEALWAPIGQALPSQTKRIIISPDGALNFISFATLLTKEEQFLAQAYDVQYVASGRDLLRELNPSTAKEVVLFANPDFNLGAMLAKVNNRSGDAGSIRGSEKREIEDWSFGSLEGTQKESDELIKKFVGWGWTPTDFTKNAATKEALLRIHSPYILHLATHGFFAKEDPTATQTEALSNERQSVTKSKFFKNPMHRSGLALAGAQTTIEAWQRDEVRPNSGPRRSNSLPSRSVPPACSPSTRSAKSRARAGSDEEAWPITRDAFVQEHGIRQNLSRGHASEAHRRSKGHLERLARHGVSPF